MSLTSVKLLGVNITISTKQDILEEIYKYLKKSKVNSHKSKLRDEKPLVIFTPNPEIINFAVKNPNFREIVNSAQINIPDGAGVVWAMKKVYGMNLKRIPGADLIDDLVRMASEKGFRVGLIGGRSRVALKASECLQKKYPGLEVEVLGEPEVEVGRKKQEVRSKNDENISFTVKKIKERKIDILFVALGFPKQEYFIESVKRKALSVKLNRPLILMAVGGAFDYISGAVPRAPFWMRNKGLEWLFRLIAEPKRLGRQLRGGEFFYRILKINLQKL